MNQVTSSKFEKFFSLSVDMLSISNLDGFFEVVNDAFVLVLGYSKEELTQTPYLNFVHPQDIDATKKEMRSLSKGKSTQHFSNRFKHKDGHFLTFEWTAQYDSESKRIYSVARDITEQANSNRRLIQLEKTLYKESIVVQTDKAGVITEVNDKFCEISGYTREELIGKTHSIVNSGYHSKAFFQNLWKTISSGNIWTGLIKNRKKNGESYFVYTIITPIFDHEGEITNYLAIRQDITDTINQEASLSKTTKILNETSQIAKVGGWELDIATGELTWTDETFRILEVEKRNDQVPMLPEGLKLFTEEHQPIIEQAVNDAAENGKPYSLELQAKTAKGNVLWVYTNGKANYKDGKIVTLSGTIQDIQARKEAELKYEKERQKSIVASKLASLGELSASMAHEINNPLGIISGYAELTLHSSTTPDAVRPSMEVILKSCKRIAHMVGNLKNSLARKTLQKKLYSPCIE